MIKIHKKSWSPVLTKGTAVFVCVMFLSTSVYLPQAKAEVSPVAMVGYRSLADDLTAIALPKEIGKIQETYRGTSNKVVVLIQDAHSIPDAQRSIRSTIDHFQKKYGVSLVGLEGASEKLDPQIFKSFPDKDLLHKIFDAYARRGELTGGTAAALFNTSTSTYHGIEDWPLYEEGISYFLRAAAMESEIKTLLDPIVATLNREKETVYSKELLEIDRLLASFDKNKTDLVQVLNQLSKYQPPPKGSELTVLLEEIQQDQITETPIEIEIKKIAEQVASALKSQSSSPETREELREYYGKLQEFRTARMTPQAFALYLKDLANKHQIQVKVSRKLTYLVENQKRLKDIEGTRLFEEFKRYAESVRESLFQNDQQKSLNIQARKLELIERLIRLELSFEDWGKIQKLILHRDRWTVAQGEPPTVLPRSRNLDGPVSQDGVASRDKVSELLKKMEPHLAFYHVAEKRDQVFLKNIQAMMEKQGKASSVLVAGGFHTEGLTQLFKAKGISYVLVMPWIGVIPEEPLYREHMRGQVSWSDYFEVKDGKVNLYDAFVRATRDKLLGDKNASAKGGKEWRDQIIRDLATDGRITQASEYTHFIDETTQPSSPSAQSLREKWIANIDRFGEGLKKLQTDGNLNESSILKLTGSTTGVPAENPLCQRAELREDLLPSVHRSGTSNVVPSVTQHTGLIEALPSADTKEPLSTMFVFMSHVRDESKVDYPLGITKLAGHLKDRFQNEIKVAMVHSLVEGNIENVIQKIASEKPKILGLSLGFGSLEEFYSVMRYVRSLPAKERPVVVLGNVVATYNVEFFLERFPEVFIAMGVGEDAMLGIVSYYRGDISKKQIPGVAYAENGEIVMSRPEGITLGPSMVPYPILKSVVDTGGVVYMETSRGCPFKCAICDRRTFQGGARWKGYEVDAVVGDMIEVAKLGVRNINFVDEDLFAGNIDRVLELARKIKEAKEDGRLPKDLMFGTSSSVRHIYSQYSQEHNQKENEKRKAAFIAMRDAGLKVLFIGIESGSPTQLRRYGKAATIRENEAAIRIIEELGITVIPGFIMMDQKVTPQEIRENIAFLRRTGMSARITYPLKLYIPMKTSPLTGDYIKQGLVDSDSYNPDHLAYDRWFFENAKVAKALTLIKQWEDSQALLFWELKIVFRSSKFGGVSRSEKELLRNFIDEQTTILLDYLDDAIGLSDKEADDPLVLSRLSAKYGHRLIEDMVSVLKALAEGRMTLGGKVLPEVVFRGMLREIVRLYFQDKEFTREDIVGKLRELSGYETRGTQFEEALKSFVNEDRIRPVSDDQFMSGPQFNVYRDIPWPDMPHPAKITRAENRSEIRLKQWLASSAFVKSVEVLKPGGESQKLSREEAREVIKFALTDLPAFIIALKAAVDEQMAKLTATGVKVDRRMADRMIKRIIMALERSGIEGNLTIAFNVPPDKNFLEALQAMKADIGTAVFSKAMARGMPADFLKTFNTQIVSNFTSYKPLAAENTAVPVVASDLGEDYLSLNESLFGVGVNTGGAEEGEPFLEVVENVVKIASGLLLALRLKSPKDLKNPAKAAEIKAELLKILFGLKKDSGVLSIDSNGHLIVNRRGLLQQILLEYQASSEVHTAA